MTDCADYDFAHRDIVELKYQDLIDDWLARSEFFNTEDVFDK